MLRVVSPCAWQEAGALHAAHVGQLYGRVIIEVIGTVVGRSPGSKVEVLVDSLVASHFRVRLAICHLGKQDRLAPLQVG